MSSFPHGFQILYSGMFTSLVWTAGSLFKLHLEQSQIIKTIIQLRLFYSLGPYWTSPSEVLGLQTYTVCVPFFWIFSLLWASSIILRLSHYTFNEGMRSSPYIIFSLKYESLKRYMLWRPLDIFSKLHN